MLNEVIRGIREGGLHLKWVLELKKIYFTPTLNELIVLKINHLEGAFVLLLSGLAVAFVVFFLELVFHRNTIC